MSATGALLAILVAWLAIGVVASVVMGRRGHAPFSWGALGAALGPLVIPLVAASLRRERTAVDSVLQSPRSGEGSVDVLVGIDGSAESANALRRVIELLGSRLGRLGLSTVLDFEAADSSEQDEERLLAEQLLEEAAAEAAAAGVATPGRVLLAGKPADALIRHAREGDYELIAIGCRGRGASKVTLGSVASRLARSTEVPVLVVSA